MEFSEKTKLMVKKKANFACCWCRDLKKFIVIHHITPKEDGGTNDEDNAAPLCDVCHRLYGGNPDLRKQIREKRDHWNEICSKTMNPEYGWPIGHDVPLLDHYYKIEPTEGIPRPGIQFTDIDLTNSNVPPLLYLICIFQR